MVGVSYILQGDAMVHNMDPAAWTPDHGAMWVQEGPHLGEEPPGSLEQTQLQLNLGDSRFRRLVIPFVSAGQEAGRHDTSPVDGSA